MPHWAQSRNERVIWRRHRICTPRRAQAPVPGQTALTSLVALRSQQEPQRLIDLRWGTGPDGTVLVKASNTTPRTLLGINLQIRLTDPLGSVNLYTQRLASIPANRSLQFDTQLRPGSGRVAVSVEHRVRHSLTRSSLRRHMCAGLMLPAAPPPAGYLAAASWLPENNDKHTTGSPD